MTQTFSDYGTEFQEKFVQALLVDEKFAEQMLDVFKSEYIDVKHLQFLADRYFVYARKFRVFPSLRLLISIIRDDLRNRVDVVLRDRIVQYIKKIKDNPDAQDLPWVKEKALDFCKKQALREALEKSIDLISTEKYEAVVEVMKAAVMVGTAPAIGHNLMTDIDSRFERITRDCVPTGIEQLDRKGILNGGSGKGELLVVVAAAGVGKCVVEDTHIHIRHEKIKINGQQYNSWDKVQTSRVEIYAKDIKENDELICCGMLIIEREIVEEEIKMGDLFESIGFSKDSPQSDEDGDSTFDMSSFNVEVLSDVGYNKIEALRWTKEEEYVELTYLETIHSNMLHSLKCSPDHIVRVISPGETLYEWRKVRNLKRGDLLKTSQSKNSSLAVVVDVENMKESDRLCDIQVNDVHCYYANDVLSHNSHFLVQIGKGAFSRGLNVIHYTMELSEPNVGIRYDSNLCEIDADDILEQKEIVREYYETNKGAFGRLIIKEFPTNFATAFTLRSHIERLALTGFVPDLVIVDYADVMRSTRKFESLRHELRQVYEDLRQMAGELRVPVWTACFHGETIIQSPFGDFKIKDMVGKRNLPVYSYNNETDKIELKTTNNVYLSNEDVEVFEVELDNREKIIATATHNFMTRDGKYKELKDLCVGDSLMPLRRYHQDDWEVVKQNDGSVERVCDMLDKWRKDRVEKIDNENFQIKKELKKNLHARVRVTKFGSLIDERITRHIELAKQCDTRDEFTERTRDIPLRTWRKVKIWNEKNENNHKVVSIKSAGRTAVYNMEVDELHNYALGAGIIVKNSQSNKEGALADVIDITNMSEAFGKAMTADFIISISRKAQEKASGRGRIFVAKNRAGRDGLLYPLTIDTARSKFELGSDTIDSDQERISEKNDQKKKMRAEWDKLMREKSKKIKLIEAHDEKSVDDPKKDDEDHSKDSKQVS